jgi:hypothetical protein
MLLEMRACDPGRNKRRPMICWHRQLLPAVIMPAMILLLAGCVSNLRPFSSEETLPPAVRAVVPPSVRPEEIVGRWGFSSYHRDQDRSRTEAAAREQCAQPYLIDRSSGGNVIMLGHDNPQPLEMILKGSVEGKTYVGPGSDPAGADDREVVSFDGRVLILKWVDPEIAGRYGTMVLVRCGAEGTGPRVARAKRAPAAN